MNAKRIIIDCDPGIDDAVALMYILKNPRFHVEAIVTVCGNIDAHKSAKNANLIGKMMTGRELPIYVGNTVPLEKPFEDAEETHGEDGLGNSGFDTPQRTFEENGVEKMAEILRDATESIDIFALGPLTNIAELLTNYPEVCQNIGTIYSMGGNHCSHGNTTSMAEFNYWCDPDAAAIVFEECSKLGLILHMIGLDVTREYLFTPNILSYLKRLNPEMGEVVERLTSHYLDFHWEYENLIGCIINDVLVPIFAIYPEYAGGFESYVEVARDGAARGVTLVDTHNFYKQEPNCRVYNKIDRNRAMAEMLTVLSGEPYETILEKIEQMEPAQVNHRVGGSDE